MRVRTQGRQAAEGRTAGSAGQARGREHGLGGLPGSPGGALSGLAGKRNPREWTQGDGGAIPEARAGRGIVSSSARQREKPVCPGCQGECRVKSAALVPG